MSELKKEELIKENVSGNIKTSNKEIEILKTYFSNCFDKDGNFNFEKFKDLMTEKEVNFSSESYVLNWLGKSYARFLINEEATTFLRENKAHNEKPENINSENILIKGDNLEVLKHLVGAYYEKIKMIYIDPPYNTGSDDFLYQDSRKYTAQELMDKIGINEEKALKIIEFTQSRSNSHSAWMTFMYPRLYIAKQLLRDDGFIFISIDDNEVAQLKLIMDEIYGEENFIAQLTVVRHLAGHNDEFGFSKVHEYCICYAKNKAKTKFNEFVVDENTLEKWEKDEIGYFKIGSVLQRSGKNAKREESPTMFFPLLFKDNELSLIEESEYLQIYDKKTKTFNDDFLNKLKEKYENLGYDFILPFTNGKYGSWLWGYYAVNKTYLNQNIVVNKKNGKIYLLKKQRPRFYEIPSRKPKTLFYKPEYSSASGVQQLKNLFNEKYFESPKSVNLIKDLLKLVTEQKENDIILDFFAGSGTTGDAVMQLNAEDGGNRRFILVQLDEPIKPRKNKEAYNFVKNELKAEPTIFEITKERLIRAAKNIKEEINKKIIEKKQELEEETDEEQKKQLEEEINNLEKQDLGFQVFETFPIWNNYVIPEEYDPNFEVFDGNTLSHEDLMALLTTWKVYDGMPLTQKLTEVDLDGYTAYYSSEKKKMYLMFGNFSTKNLITLLRKVDMDKTFDLKTVVLFGYTIPANMIFELSQNFKTFKRRTKIDLKRIIRY